MKNFLLSTLLFIAPMIANAQIDCKSIKSDSVRIRIVTLSQPNPWQNIPIKYIVKQEDNLFVFYSEKYGNYCEMQTFFNENFKEKTPYCDAQLVICNKPKKNKKNNCNK
jgi:hypothetical protein